jgi:hypothetical protein
MSRIKVIVTLIPEQINKLEVIGRSGVASSGYSQEFDFCLNKAIDEFIKKYEKILDEKND